MNSAALKDAAQDPDAGKLSQSIFDLLMIELVPMAERLAKQIHKLDMAGDVGNPDPSREMDDDELKENMFYRLENLGYRVGLGVIESLTSTATSSPLPVPHTHLDIIKFLCKDLWVTVFRKQIDNLKTNHRGTFVLTDNTFHMLKRCSLEAGKMDEARAMAGPFLHFPAGLVRGSLKSLGLDAEVAAEVAAGGVPGAVFVVRVIEAGGEGTRGEKNEKRESMT